MNSSSPETPSVPAASASAAPSDARYFGVSAQSYAALALCALIAAKGIAPALPGTATGIAQLIAVTNWFAACTTQLVAAGGVVMAIRLLGVVFTLPSLGIAFRLMLVPTGLSVIALVTAAATQPLEPEFGKLLTLTALVTTAALIPFLLARPSTRTLGITLAALALGGALDLVAYEMGRQLAATEVAPRAFARACAGAATLLDFAACLLTAQALTANVRARLRVLLAVSGAVLGALVLGALGSTHTAHGALVLIHRSIETLAARALLQVPALLAEASTLLMLGMAGSALFLARFRADVRAAMSLALLARIGSGSPTGALLSVASVLLLARAVNDPHLVPERLHTNVAI